VRIAYIVVAIVIIAIVGFFAYQQLGKKPETTTPPTTSPVSPSPTSPAKVIEMPIGVLLDESGPTSDVGKPYAAGAISAIEYFNEKGIFTKDGVRVKLVYTKRDYAYNPTRAVEFFKEFRDRYKVWAILGWGTADTETLAPETAKAKIPYISASYSAALVKQPYNFFPVPDYSTQAVIMLKWASQKKPGGKVVLLYDNTIAYCRSPIPALKEFADDFGLQVVAEIHLPLKATEADAERVMKEAATHNPDIIWCGNTITSCSLAAKAMGKLGIDAIMIINVWGFDERFPEMATELAWGKVAAAAPLAYPHVLKEKDPDLYNLMVEAAKNAGYSEKDINFQFIKGFTNALLLIKAIERVDSKDLETRKGEAIKEVLEASCTGDPFNLGALAPTELRYCEGLHVAHTSAWVAYLGSDGKIVLEGPISVSRDLKTWEYHG